MKPHVFHPDAYREYAAAALHYAQIGPDLGGRFHDEIERLILEIRTRPRLFRAIAPPLRRHLARDFPYAVIYVEEAEYIWIVAVMPLKREPGYWKRRLDT